MSSSNSRLLQDTLTELGQLDILLAYAHAQNKANFIGVICRIITQLDAAISEQLSEVIEAPEFKRLEASWSSLKSLITLPVSYRKIKVKLFDASWQVISTDINHSFDIKRSSLFTKIFSNELDTAGGQPFGLLVVDHYVDPNSDNDFDDLYTLQLIAELGSHALCPVVVGVAEEQFFGDELVKVMHDHARIKRILSSRDLQNWQQLRSNIAARFLHLALPQYCIRQPRKNYAAGFVFNEKSTNKAALWGNAAYLLAVNVMREFDRISWFGFLRAHDSRGSYGAVIELDSYACKPLVAQVDIFSENDSFWAEQGFIALSSVYMSDQLGFFSNQSVWLPENEKEKTTGMLQSNLMACRFGHYIKSQIRDKVGTFESALSCQYDINTWLQTYTSNVNYGDETVMARFPLKAASVSLVPNPNDETRYQCKINLQLQYQHDTLETSITLISDVAAGDVGENQ